MWLLPWRQSLRWYNIYLYSWAVETGNKGLKRLLYNINTIGYYVINPALRRGLYFDPSGKGLTTGTLINYRRGASAMLYNCQKNSTFYPHHGNLEFFAAHLSVINARLLAKLHTYQLLLRGMVFKNNFDLSDSLFSLRLSGFIFRSGNFLPDPYFYTPPN
jgi:hypothetical protein